MVKASHERKKAIKKWPVIVLIVAVLFAGGLIFTNAAVMHENRRDIVSPQEARQTGAGCILVLGARVDGGEPSVILENRLETGVELYRQGAAPKLLLTGDGGQNRYDEVSVMQQYALDAGVPAQDIVLDREGFDTYSSVYRAKNIFEMDSVLMVTQPYHMTRALFDARALGLDAFGVLAAGQEEGQWYRNIREIAARAKDYVICLFKPGPTHYN